MPFRFSLATVLKYREEIEKREERTLEQRKETLSNLEHKLTEVIGRRDAIAGQRYSLLERGSLGDDLHHVERTVQQLDNLKTEIQRMILVAQQSYDAQLTIFRDAHQKREILFNLKMEKKQTYMSNQERREQQKIDEMFVARLDREP